MILFGVSQYFFQVASKWELIQEKKMNFLPNAEYRLKQIKMIKERYGSEQTNKSNE